jgi:ATP-binding cassette subfamily F protein uup
LVKLLLGKLKPDSGEISYGTNLEVVYFDQLRAVLDEQKTVWENVLPHGDTLQINGKSVHIVTYLQNFLFPPERTRCKVSILSGGERNRVLLAKLFAAPANFLVLDEPTNDLDIETLELLEELLVEFSGTVLVICHDRAFLNNLVTSTIAFAKNGEVREIVGGYDDWMNERRALAELENKSEEAEKEKARSEAKKAQAARRSAKLSFNEKRELQALPALIEAAENELTELQNLLAQPEFYKSGEDVQAVKTRMETLETNLMSHLERWEELESKNE